MSRKLRVIEAPPGAGRSARILHEMLSRLRAGEVSVESALVLAPTSADARLLSARFDHLAVACGEWFPVRFDTMQGVARQLLAKDAQFAYHRPMDDVEERLVLQAIVTRALSEEGRAAAGLSSSVYADAVSLRSQSFIEDVHAFIAELKQHRVAPAPNHPGSAAVYHEFILDLSQQDELQALGIVYRMYQEILRKEQRYDAQGVLWNAYVVTEDPRFWDRLPPYRRVYYDDVQDMSALEAELLARIVQPDTELVVTHCPTTAAFRFRYALRDPVASLSSLLSQNNERVEIIHEDLDVIRRAVHEPPLQSRPQSEIAFPVRAVREPPAKTPPQNVPTLLWACPDVRVERDAVAAEIVSLLEGKESAAPRQPEEIAVITRTHTEAQEIAVVLDELGIPVNEAAGGAGVGSALVLLDHILAFLEGGLALLRSGKGAAANSSFERSLLVLAGLGMDGADVSTSIMAAVETLHEEDIPLAEPNSDGTELVFAPPIGGRWERLDQLNEALRRYRQGQSIAEVLAWLIATSSLDRVLEEPLFSSTMRALGRALQRISMAEQTVHRLGGQIDPSAIRWQLRQLVGRGAQPENQEGVAILPAHETRGREWPIVFLPRLNEHIFPADPHISALFHDSTAQGLKERAEQLAARRKLGSGAFSFVGFAEDPRDSREEEDRLFHLAATRATERLILSWSERDAESEISPSVYVRRAVAKHSGCSVREIDWTEASERLCHTIPRKGYWYPPTRERITRPSALGEPVFQSIAVRHSPSSLSTGWLCPRKYFYGRVLELDRTIGDPQVYGILVHSILQTLLLQPPENHNAKVILQRPDIQEIIEKHHRRFSSETMFVLSMRRFESALQDFLNQKQDFFDQQLFMFRGKPAVELKLERKATAANRNIQVVGKIDVAVRDPKGRVQIIDFKTSQPLSVRALRRSMVYRETEDNKVSPANRDYQLPLYRFLLATSGEILLSHFHFQPAYAGRKGFKEVTMRVVNRLPEDPKEVSESDLDTSLNEALKLAVDFESVVHFAREPKNQACRHGGNECPFLFLCDRIEEE